MKISVTHSTVYRYDRPVQLGPHVIRLRPREDASQKLLCYELRFVLNAAASTEIVVSERQARLFRQRMPGL